LSDEEKQRETPDSKSTGNNFHHSGKPDEAASQYGQALKSVEKLILN
jgi:hypothetical protein